LIRNFVASIVTKTRSKMTAIRFNALETVLGRSKVVPDLPPGKISEYYATNVFTHEAMQEYLSEEAFISVMSAIKSGTRIDRKIADQVASSMKAWAMKKGATHFTHWFQPLTGATAEKHDAFFTPTGMGKGVENFNGEALTQQEPDASSFPNGGIRNTFEARGYTAWDPSSPAFIMEIGEGKTLCIPTIFVAYTGEALDYKAPLLKAIHALELAAVPVCQYFDKNVTRVTPSLGWEQEYFVVDEALFYARPDLVMTGRTVFGHTPAKGQQLDDHYFGSIPERVYAFMLDLESESLKLGIPLRTRHNEVAPGQYECAPQFEEANLAVDQNQLLMDLMDRIGRRHKLRVLLHEKPFAGINGSGKHNNWSMGTDTGKNLLSPGHTPKNNIQFLTFFVNTIKAVNDHEALLRASFASAGNDFRLGANEAPPAIISVFIGSHLTEVLNEIEARGGDLDEADKTILKLDIHNKIPEIMLDNTDRNRTSPFAFTGNKFEVRTVGSSANCAAPMTVLNTIVANQLAAFKQEVDALIKDGTKKDAAILKVLQGYIKDSKRILFEGDGYSQEWADEAAKRGLSNTKNTPRALEAYLSESSKKVFLDNEIFNEVEMEARSEIRLESYTMTVQIESRIVYDMAMNHIIPAAVAYQNEILANINGLREAGLKPESYAPQAEILEKITALINGVITECESMRLERKAANAIQMAKDQAVAYCDKVKPYTETIRYKVDKLEQLVDDKLWPLPKYRELLFVR
jgi:glutamine synthetase